MNKQQPSSADDYFLQTLLLTQNAGILNVVFVRMYFALPISDELIFFIHLRKNSIKK